MGDGGRREGWVGIGGKGTREGRVEVEERGRV